MERDFAEFYAEHFGMFKCWIRVKILLEKFPKNLVIWVTYLLYFSYKLGKLQKLVFVKYFIQTLISEVL